MFYSESKGAKIMEFKTGWLKDKFDDKDYLHKPKVTSLPTNVDMSPLLPSVRNQGQVGSCMGFGIGANLCTVVQSWGAFTEWYSPTWIYNGARYINGDLTHDTGAFPKDGLDWLLKSGCLLEHFWPYNDKELDQSPPSSERMAQAEQHSDFAYYRVDNGVTGIISALADGHCVSIGTPWFYNWLSPSLLTGNLSKPTVNDNVVGGHETCLYGYDSNKGIFYGMNSWGKGWGNLGHFKMPFESFDVFKQLGGYDAHYITFSMSPVPKPPHKCWLVELFRRN
jgi:hypothetical protein